MLRFFRKICHFDIKPANVFIGDRDQSEHRRLEVFKLADYGLSLFAPGPFISEMERVDWIEETEWRASPKYMSPEQLYQKHQNRDIGPAAGIWSVGSIMWAICAGKNPEIRYVFNHKLAKGFSQISGDPQVLFNTNLFPYSNHFINTLCGCLTYDPADRLTSDRLLKECLRMVNIYDKQSIDEPIVPDSLTSFNEPEYNELPMPSGPPRTRFQLQNFNTPVRMKLSKVLPRSAGDQDMIDVEETNFPELLFSAHVPAAEPTQANYPFVDLSPTPPGPPES
ncbi:kinase-like protein [Mollisia scopiformis]|uniref:non-specific serine/threonine protein kinase n=1 Tax=Mollisia scopiformis TaxID=149040 RepID=A0A194X3J1_MOLSC|nr:kinase-like protein [Mollisia scopiformis]KUJ14758.1 kinase-like protein [Mollisia scopiformis]